MLYRNICEDSPKSPKAVFKFYKPIKQFSHLQGSWDVNDGKTNRQPYLPTLFNRNKTNGVADKRRSGQMSEQTNVESDKVLIKNFAKENSNVDKNFPILKVKSSSLMNDQIVNTIW